MTWDQIGRAEVRVTTRSTAMTMMKTTSLLETAEKTLGVRWPYTVADIERANDRLEGRARKNDPKLIQSAVTQCRMRARQALAAKVSTRNKRSTPIHDELSRQFPFMSQSYFWSTTSRQDRITVSLAVL